nr:unnamed protein product [Callosobruchus analis]
MEECLRRRSCADPNVIREAGKTCTRLSPIYLMMRSFLSLR